MATSDYYSSGIPKYFKSNLDPSDMPDPADPLFGTTNHQEYAQAVDNYLERLNTVIHVAWCAIKPLAFEGVPGLIGRVVLLIFKSDENISNAPAGNPTSVQ